MFSRLFIDVMIMCLMVVLVMMVCSVDVKFFRMMIVFVLLFFS